MFLAAILCYFLLRFAFEKFLFDKIRLIYRRIYPLQKSEEKLRQPLDLSSDIVGQVSQEVARWVEDNQAELAQLKKAETFRREFLANVSHELKTPIFSIQGYLHTLLDGAVSDPEVNILYIEKAARAVDRLCIIVDDLESISRLESGELVIDLRKFNLPDLVSDIFESLEIKAQQKQIRLDFASNYGDIWVEADKELIRQVIVNLLVNSIKYGKTGGRTTVGFWELDDKILVEVSDNGIGIAQEHLPRLFERFYRVDKSRSRDQGGTGLGLSIVKHIIEAHNHSVGVRSLPGEGSTFSFTIKKA